MQEEGVEDNTQFASQEYWDTRYKKEAESQLEPETFEWVKGWPFYSAVITPLIPSAHSSILHLGCGNSRFAIDMFEQAGFTNHTNLDYSPAVIEMMRRKFAVFESVKWIVGDIFELDKAVSGETFDVVFDKGTLDAFLTGFPDDDPWDPSPECLSLVKRYMEQVHSVVKPSGVFVHITWAQPHFRKSLVQITGMEVNVKKVGTDWEYFVYVCHKRE